MTGDHTSVPLRTQARWTGARMQQGKVLLDGDHNLTVDAAAREQHRLAGAVIGPAGVPQDSPAFEVSYAADGTLQLGPGELWAGGLRAYNPVITNYLSQETVPPLPASGNAVLVLDTFVEEVMAAEDPDELLDPALDGIDTMTRTRVGWRVRAMPVDATSCAGAAPTVPKNELSTGLLNVVRTSPAVPMDPCAPPDDPRGKLPDGLLRVEVLDSGTAATARFCWSYENGSAAVAASVAGAAVTLRPSPDVTFFPGDLVEVSTLVRRADRIDHGPLFEVDQVEPGAGGSVVTLTSAASVTGTPSGLCLRRWDGQTVGAAAQVTALLDGVDVGVAFSAEPGTYIAGDWWAVRVRGSSADAVEELTKATPDGTRHTFTAVAMIDLAAKKVLSDCRPKFPVLTQIRGGTCTVTALPGDDLQAAADRLPDEGGELCLAAGAFGVDDPVVIRGKQRIVVTGVGPATILRSLTHETVLMVQDCADVTIKDLRVEGGLAAGPERPAGDEHLYGAISFLNSSDVTVKDCEVTCPDSAGRTQSAIYAAGSSKSRGQCFVRILGNRLTVGDQQTGILVVSPDEVTVDGNEIRLAEGPLDRPERPWVHPFLVREISTFVGSHVVADTAEKGHDITLAGGKTMRVAGATVVQRLAGQFGKTVTERALSRSITPRKALQRFTRRALLAPDSLGLSREATRFLAGASRTRAVGQGIVVGGSQAPLVRISDNVLAEVIQGIHVGLGTGANHADAGTVVIERNVIGCSIPFFWSRSRHAIFVGSAQSVRLTDNVASLRRTGGSDSIIVTIAATPVEAVRLYGRYQRQVRVQGLDLTGLFAAGVAVTDLGVQQERRLIWVSDVINASLAGPAVTPDWIDHDRCIP